MSRRPQKRPARRFHTRWRWLAAAIVLGLLLAADNRGWLLVRNAHDLPRYHGQLAVVDHVIDGDTIDIALPDELSDADVTRIRLWGIDCPELAHFDQPEQPLAREASSLASAMVEGRQVRLYLEAHQPRDAYGRVLAHVELTDGRSLNEALLEAGLARADDRWPHTRLTRYAQVELAARRAKIGLWSGSRREATTAPQGN